MGDLEGKLLLVAKVGIKIVVIARYRGICVSPQDRELDQKFPQTKSSERIEGILLTKSPQMRRFYVKMRQCQLPCLKGRGFRAVTRIQEKLNS